MIQKTVSMHFPHGKAYCVIEILKQKAHREQQTDDLKIAQLHIKNEQQAVELQEAHTANSSRNPTPGKRRYYLFIFLFL